MNRRRLLASAVPVVCALAGCTDFDTGDATTTATPERPKHNTCVFDHAGLDRTVLEGGTT